MSPHIHWHREHVDGWPLADGVSFVVVKQCRCGHTKQFPFIWDRSRG